MADGFTKEPESVVQAQGLEAVFECHYHYFLFVCHMWLINGELARHHSWVSNLCSDTLKVTALPEYDNATIQCIAVSKRAGGRPGIVTLRIQGELQLVSTQSKPLVKQIQY